MKSVRSLRDWVAMGRSAVNGLAMGMLVAGGLLVCAPGQVAAQQMTTAAIAPTPPLGWNSWDAYGMRIGEEEFRAAVNAMAAKLKPYGYTYAVIDEGWYMVNPEDRPKPELLKYAFDGNGRFIPAVERFPSAMQKGKNTGFEQLANYVHSRGLKFGIHVIRGSPRESVAKNAPIEGTKFTTQDAADQSDPCPWDPTSWGVKDNEAGQAWYDALVRQYAQWGVDYLKVDCISDHPYKLSEIKQLHLAIVHSGRPIVLSLSPGPTNLSHQAEVAELAEMWRISNDVWDVWQGHGFPIGIKNQFPTAAEWAQYAKPGNWPDADMLPIGELRPYPDMAPGARHTRLSLDEQKTQLSLWAMARSPLIFGGNVTLLDKETTSLLTNREMLRIDQTATASRQVIHEDDFVAWTSDLAGGEHALALFNLGDSGATVTRPLTDFGLAAGAHQMRDVWSESNLPASENVSARIEPHGTVLLIVK